MTPSMNATPRQIALMRASLPMLSALAAPLSEAVCSHLLHNAPQLRATWAHTALSRSRRLIDTMLEAAPLIETPDRARRAVALLAHDLRGQGLSPRDYVALHAGLLEAIGEPFGQGSEVEAAWAEVIGTLLAHMLAEAHGPRRTPVSLAA